MLCIFYHNFKKCKKKKKKEKKENKTFIYMVQKEN